MGIARGLSTGNCPTCLRPLGQCALKGRAGVARPGRPSIRQRALRTLATRRAPSRTGASRSSIQASSSRGTGHASLTSGRRCPASGTPCASPSTDQERRGSISSRDRRPPSAGASCTVAWVASACCPCDLCLSSNLATPPASCRSGASSRRLFRRFRLVRSACRGLPNSWCAEVGRTARMRHSVLRVSWQGATSTSRSKTMPAG